MQPPDAEPQTSGHCRFCGSRLHHTVVDLGTSPLCESYVSPDRAEEMEPFYPLHVYVCEQCWLVQLNRYVSREAIFGDYAYRVPISASKSMLGHLIGCAGAAETMVCILSILNGIIPPTINYDHADPDCDLDYVPNVARKAEVNTALSNSFGFGGHNSVLIVRKYSEA